VIEGAAASAALSVFIDDGGVMNDNARRAEQWAPLVGAFFSPRLGGSPDAWASANREIAHLWTAPGRFASDFAAHCRAYDLAWLGGMCQRVGVRMPPEAEALALAAEAAGYVARRVRAAYPGAAAAIRELSARGCSLHTASNERSAELDGDLEGMGVRDCFGLLFGPDLVNAWKDGPGYYERIFAHAGLHPAAALVVDDNADAIAWAKAVGAHVVHLGTDIATLADLPGMV
jgi:HAD superfamily hydrolase (TIGR01509 family)